MQPFGVPSWREDAPPGISLAAAQSLKGVPPKATAESGLGVALGRVIRTESAQRWTGWLARDYTPSRIEQVLRGALWGSHVETWELFHLMEDTWPRLAKALAEIKRGVAHLDWRIEPWSEEGAPPTPDAEHRAGLVSRAMWSMRPAPDQGGVGFEGMIAHVLDAWSKGTSVVEIEWQVRSMAAGRLVAPKAAHWVHPSNYAWGADGRMGLRTTGHGGGLDPFPPHQFLICRAPARSGPLGTTALLRPLAWWWSAANFSASWLLNLAQIFGLPIRWATYASGASDQLISQICGMLENMGSSAWGAFPAGTQIELKEPAKGAGSWPQEGLLDRCDRQCDLLILGQTLTTDVGASGSLALGGVHKSVRDEIIDAAANWAASVINQQLVPSILELNYGDAESPPEFCPVPMEVQDLKANAERDRILIDAGVPMPRDWFYRRHQIPLPKEGEAVIGRQAPEPDSEPAPERRPPDNEDEDEPEDIAGKRAVSEDRDAMEDIIASAVAGGVGARRAWLAPINEELRRLAAVAADPERSDAEVLRLLEAGRARLPELFDEIDTSRFAGHLADVLGASARAGAETVLTTPPAEA